MSDIKNNKQLNIVLVDVDKIIPYWRNPRRNDKTVEWLTQIIRHYGFNVPMVLDQQNVIVKGHARLKAAKRIGMKQVPCIYSENDDETNKADRIADNKIQEMSYWDLAKLEMEYQRIGELKFEKLFHPEEVEHLTFDPGQAVSFEATSLGDYDGFDSDDDENAPNSSEYPQYSPGSYEADSDTPYSQQEGDNTGAPQEAYLQGAQEVENNSSLPKGTRALKTVCPYCGADVYIKL